MSKLFLISSLLLFFVSCASGSKNTAQKQDKEDDPATRAPGAYFYEHRN